MKKYGIAIGILIFISVLIIVFAGKQTDTIDIFDFIPIWLYELFKYLLIFSVVFNTIVFIFFKHALIKRPNYKLEIVNKGIHESKIFIIGGITIYIFFYILYPMIYGLPK